MIRVRGRVVSVHPHRIDVQLPAARLRDRVRIATNHAQVGATVTSATEQRVTLTPLGDARDVAVGDCAFLDEGADRRTLGSPLLGRAVDGLGAPLDDLPPPAGIPIAVPPPPALAERRTPSDALWTGIRAIDGLMTFARGTRIGIFGPPGSGKSKLLERIACAVRADAVVIALIGERAGEARHRLAHIDERTTLVCAPSDRAAGERLAAGDLAFAQAGRLRACGLDVALLFDSIARYAHAAREVALACGELPGPGGYPPAVFARIAELIEHAGCTKTGSITLIASVLCEDEAGGVLAEAARSLLDGHIVLSRQLADAGRFPAIDVPASLSRTMAQAVDPAHAAAALRIKAALARLAETREARELGLVAADPMLARALAVEDALEGFLRQGEEASASAETLRSLEALADRI